MADACKQPYLQSAARWLPSVSLFASLFNSSTAAATAQDPKYRGFILVSHNGKAPPGFGFNRKHIQTATGAQQAGDYLQKLNVYSIYGVTSYYGVVQASASAHLPRSNVSVTEVEFPEIFAKTYLQKLGVNETSVRQHFAAIQKNLNSSASYQSRPS